MLRAIRKILHGPVNEETFFSIVDATDWRQRAPFALLLATLLLFGFAPRLLTSKIQPSAKAIVNMANGVDARIATAASLNSASDDDAK
jgi:NADH:ubiquinone oxidoreductase subunit 4 (subunit M)